MSIFQNKLRAKAKRDAFQEAQNYCEKAEMRLMRDSDAGYWLKFDGRMRFVRSLSEVRGTVDYIKACNEPRYCLTHDSSDD